MNRRKLLGWIGMAPVAAPLAANQITAALGEKLAFDAQAAKLASIDITGMTEKSVGLGIHENNPPQYIHKVRRILANEFYRRQVESSLYEANADVRCLDPDIANKKSFSLSAKVTFQRQRNVAKELQRIQTEGDWWNKTGELIQKFVNTLL